MSGGELGTMTLGGVVYVYDLPDWHHHQCGSGGWPLTFVFIIPVLNGPLILTPDTEVI
jgi:hypothetical protein